MSVAMYLLLTAVGIVISGALSYLLIARPWLHKLYLSSHSDDIR